MSTGSTVGSNDANQLGRDGKGLTVSLAPLAISDASLTFVSLAAGDSFSCGVLADASVRLLHEVCIIPTGDVSSLCFLPLVCRLVFRLQSCILPASPAC
jgi:hypothetical protein